MHRVLLALSLSALGACSSPTPPAAAPPRPQLGLRVDASLPHAPGNITVKPTGEIIVSMHQFFSPPYPAATVLSSTAVPLAADVELGTVLGVQADPQGDLWLLDYASPPRLIRMHADGAPSRVYDLRDVTPDDQFVNDLVVDRAQDTVVIADPAGGENAALIVVNISDGSARRVLEGHVSVVAEPVDLVIDGRALTVTRPDGTTARPHVGVNPIAADVTFEWLYFGPMHGHSMYRVPMAALRDASLSEPELRAKVERYADKPICDGIAIDEAGTIYLGDLAHDAIGIITPDRQYQVLATDPRLSWADAFSFGPDGRLYTVANQLHRSPPLNGGVNEATPPFLVMSIQPLAPGPVGR